MRRGLSYVLEHQMHADPGRRKALISGVWLIGLGILFATHAWWPGIMFLVAVAAFVKGWLDDHFWVGVQAAFWSAFVGLWVLARYSLPLLLVGLGVSTIMGGLTKPNPFSKPKPFVDSRLE